MASGIGEGSLQEDDIFFCTADCGWITGHSYVTYGPMLNRASQVIFEGVPCALIRRRSNVACIALR